MNGRQNCTAIIIAPRYILTAKHGVADLAIAHLSTSVSAPYSPLGRTGDVAVRQTVQVYGRAATSQCGSEINCHSRLLKIADVRVNSITCRDYTGGIAVCANITQYRPWISQVAGG